MIALYLLICLVLFGVITILTEVEWFGWSTATLIGSVIAAHYFHIFDILGYAKGHILNSLGYAGIYVVIGVTWSFAKWFFFLRNERDRIREYNKNEKITPYTGINIPQASKNKSKIIAWMAYWPFSFIGTLLNDPIRKLFNSIFNEFKELYQKMANSIFAEDIKKLEIAQEELALKIKDAAEKEATLLKSKEEEIRNKL